MWVPTKCPTINIYRHITRLVGYLEPVQSGTIFAHASLAKKGK